MASSDHETGLPPDCSRVGRTYNFCWQFIPFDSSQWKERIQVCKNQKKCEFGSGQGMAATRYSHRLLEVWWQRFSNAPFATSNMPVSQSKKRWFFPNFQLKKSPKNGGESQFHTCKNLRQICHVGSVPFKGKTTWFLCQ